MCNAKSDNVAGPAQPAVIVSYITFLLPWLKSVNIDSWTQLFHIISLFWYDSNMLTGLMSHFGTRSFASMRLFPASAFLIVFLGTEGCCRKCRNSAYTDQKERKKDPWNKKGKQHSGRYLSFMSKIWWQPLVVSFSHQDWCLHIIQECKWEARPYLEAVSPTDTDLKLSSCRNIPPPGFWGHLGTTALTCLLKTWGRTHLDINIWADINED